MTTLPIADVRAQLSKLVDEAERTHQRVEVTRNGRRAAVLLSAEDYDSLIETLEILGDPEAMAAIRATEALADEDWVPGEVVRDELRRSGRLKS